MSDRVKLILIRIICIVIMFFVGLGIYGIFLMEEYFL